MTTPTILISFEREDYEAIKRLSPGDPYLTESFDDWLDKIAKQVADLEARGVVFQEVVINSRELAEHCRANAINCDPVARATCALAKFRAQNKNGA